MRYSPGWTSVPSRSACWRSCGGPRRACSVREVRRALGDGLAYTTVMTTLDRLFKKGLLERQRDGRAFRYATRTSREAHAAGALRRWLDACSAAGRRGRSSPRWWTRSASTTAHSCRS